MSAQVDRRQRPKSCRVSRARWASSFALWDAQAAQRQACRPAANSEPDRPGVRHVANAGEPFELYRVVLNCRVAEVARRSKGS
jgi:hypothetical protein